ILAASPIAESLGLSGLDRTRRLVLAGICGAAAVATKVTLIPLVAACLGWLVVSEWRGSKASSLGLSRLIVVCLLPGLVCLGPIALFTAVESGSPLGIVGAGWFGPSSYEASEATRVLAQVRRVNSVSVGQFLIQALMDYSPVCWFAALANIVIPPGRRFRAYWALISAVTIGVIVLVTQNDVRFFAGYPFAAIALAPAAAWMQCSKSVRCFQVVAMMAVVPWLGAMTYYSAPFVRCTAGMDSREDFLKERTAFREDFVALDQLLPPEAVLLVDGGRLNSVSAPRRVVCDVRDLRTDQGVYLLSIGNDAVAPAGFELGPAVYDNQNAVIAAYRRPGASPLRGALHVYALKAHDATSGR
ncbi:MAG TPA: hypothetical protein VM510_03930, partial [Caulifigura sp.]|nr:hypothetical protein [Caulifigura sp.]